MTPDQFKAWRGHMKFTQQAAADALGLSKITVEGYDKGRRSEGRVEIPKTVELACAALALGVKSYDGPQSK